ncbi:MAG: Antilisterial bacteriocin subtilosin biosynthesis protein AlbA [Syntrophorhabdus sp. PtaB.Bin006]|nr:MAG: Antilisterial bacteriocin subtilosin biosynthesis protein AlbA [Syntrophorhabdus sp. PtaB.Bin006]
MIDNEPFEFFIQWHLTERCNLRCRHCYQTERRTEEMTLGEITGVVGDVSDLLKSWSDAYDITFAPSVNVTGGEPFLRHDLFHILEAIGRKGFAIYVLSNGVLIDRGRAHDLSRCAVKGVQVSLEGPEPIHDTIRGKGAFAGALKGVECLIDAGLKVTLNVTLSALNADYVTDIVQVASAVGAQRLGFSRLVPSGRASGLAPNTLSAARVKETYETIFSLDGMGVEIVTGDPVASQLKTPQGEGNGGSFLKGGCAAGFSGLTFLPDGTITPCRRMGIPIGNVLRDSLREVWATSPILETLRTRDAYKGKCRSCRRWSVCRGCRAIAYAYSVSMGENDFLAEDPQCPVDDAF